MQLHKKKVDMIARHVSECWSAYQLCTEANAALIGRQYFITSGEELSNFVRECQAHLFVLPSSPDTRTRCYGYAGTKQDPGRDRLGDKTADSSADELIGEPIEYAVLM